MGRAEDLFERINDRGLDYIEQLLEEAKSEEAFLDFKRSANQGATGRLDPSDRSNLSKALSGFANSDGGVIIWGIATSKGSHDAADLASAMQPLLDCRSFAAAVDDAISGGTVPPVPGVRTLAIPLDDGKQGIAATLIPGSPAAPHQSTDTHRYFIRAGSSFVPATHGLLAGLFGREPRPNVYLQFGVHPLGTFDGTKFGRVVEVRVDLIFVNDGPISAHEAYVSWKTPAKGGERCSFNVDARDQGRWHIDQLHPQIGCSAAKMDIRVAPYSQHTVGSMRIILMEPLTEALKIEITCGCKHAAPQRFTIQAGVDEIREVIHLAETAKLDDMMNLTTKLIQPTSHT